MPYDRLLTVPEVRDRLRYRSLESAYKLIRSGQLPSVKIGKTKGKGPVRVRQSDLEAFIDAHVVKAAS